MNATITYRMAYGPNPWGKNEEKAWILWRIVTPEIGCSERGEPVAIFNIDSDAVEFQGHVLATGLDGKLVSIDRQLRDNLEELRALKSKRGT